jgi:hypothetical protein
MVLWMLDSQCRPPTQHRGGPAVNPPAQCRVDERKIIVADTLGRRCDQGGGKRTILALPRRQEPDLIGAGGVSSFSPATCHLREAVPIGVAQGSAAGPADGDKGAQV